MEERRKLASREEGRVSHAPSSRGTSVDATARALKSNGSPLPSHFSASLTSTGSGAQSLLVLALGLFLAVSVPLELCHPLLVTWTLAGQPDSQGSESQIDRRRETG